VSLMNLANEGNVFGNTTNLNSISLEFKDIFLVLLCYTFSSANRLFLIILDFQPETLRLLLSLSNCKF